MSSGALELKWASRRLRRFCDELASQGSPFVEVEWREGVDLWRQYVADTRIGRILLQFNGARWVLSLALPGARFFALYEDWMECLYGRRFGGYLGSEFASVVWLEKLLKQEGCPQIDVAVLDEIAERRTSKVPPTRMQVVLVALGAFAAVIFLFWLAIATGSNVVAAVAPMILTPLMLGLFAMWRFKLKGVPNLSATRLLSCRVVVRDLRLGGGPDMQARRKVICGAREFFW